MKMVRFKLLVLCILCVFLAGCADCLRTPLSIKDKKSVKSTVVVAATSQKKILSDSTYGVEQSYGLLPLLVESAEAKYVANKMKPITTSLNNFDVAQVFRNSLKNKLRQEKWLNTRDVTLSYDANEDDFRVGFSRRKENAMLFVTFDYRVNFKVTAVGVSLNAMLYKKDPNDKLKTIPIYYNSFNYVYCLPEKISTREEAIALWSKNNDKLIKNVFVEGVQKIVDQLVKDMRNPTSNLYTELKNKKMIYFKGRNGAKLSGKLIERAGDYYVVRMDDDSVFIFNKDALWVERPRGIFR